MGRLKSIAVTVIVIGLMAAPQAASALKFTPAAGSPLTLGGELVNMSTSVRNTGNAAATAVVLKTTAPKRLANAPKAIKVPSLAAGQSISKKIKVKLKKSATKGKKLAITVIASVTGTTKVTAKRTAKIR